MARGAEAQIRYIGVGLKVLMQTNFAEGVQTFRDCVCIAEIAFANPTREEVIEIAQ